MATSPLRILDTPARGPILDSRPMGLSMQDEAALDASGGSVLTNSFVGALHGSDANRAAAEESSLRAAGGEADLYQAANLRQAALEAQQRAQAYAAPVSQYEQIRLGDEGGVGRAGSWLAGQVGQGMGSSVEQMAAGGAMGVAGGLLSLAPNPLISGAGGALRNFGAPATMYKMNADLLKGEAYNTVAKDPVAMQRSAQEIDDEVSAHGYRAAVMDTAGQLLPMGRAVGLFGKGLSKVPMGAKFAGGVALEGATETGQQISQHYAHEALNPERDTTHDSSENWNSLLGGAAGGGGMNAVGHAGEAVLNRLGTKGDGANGDKISLDGGKSDGRTSLIDGMKASEAGMSPEEHSAKLALLDGSSLMNIDMLAPDFEEQSIKIGTQRRDTMVEELGKMKTPQAAALAAELGGLDMANVDNSFADVFTTAAKLVTGPAGLTSPEAIAALARGKKKKSEQIPASDMGSKTGSVPDVDPKGAAKSAKDSLAAFGSDMPGAPADTSTHAERSDYNSKLLWQHFTSNTTETKIPVNRSSKDVMDMFGDELAAMASQGVREAPTPAELQRATVVGRALATMLGPKVEGVLDTIAKRNGIMLKNRQESIGGNNMHLGAPVNDSPVFQAMYEKAVSLHDGSTTHETEAISRGERVKELVGMVPTPVATALLDKGVDLSSPKAGEYLTNAIEALSQGDEKRRVELNKLLTKPVVDKMVDLMSHGAPIEARDVPVESVSGKTAATDSDTAGISVGEAEVSGFEQRQAQKSLDKSPPESLVFHHKRGVGTVTKLQDAFKETSTGKLPALIKGVLDKDGNIVDEAGVTQKNTVPDGRVGKAVEQAARLLRNATKTLRGRNGKWSLGRNHNLRATSALEVMDSANINDSKREQLMFRYIEQEGGPDVTDLKNMLGTVKSLEAYDRQYTAATIKREKLSPGGGKLSMVEADELAHPGGSQGTLSALANLAATPEDAALALSTFTKDTATRNTILMGVVRRAKAEALKQLAGTNGFRSFVATTQANESRTPEFKELVNHFFSKRHMVVAEHKSDGDYLKMDLATFSTMVHDGLDLLATASHIGSKKKQGKAFQVADQIRAEHEMGLLRWYHSDYSPSKPGKGEFDDKSARVVIQAKDLVAWVRAQRNDHTTGKGDGSVRGENFGETRKNEDYLRDLTDGIMGLVDQGLVRGMPYIVNGEVHDKTNPTDEERGWTKEDGTFELYTKEGGKVDLTKVNPKDLAGREEWFEEASMVKNLRGLKAAQKAWAKRAAEETLDVAGAMPTEAEMVFADGVPPSLDLNGRSYSQMVKARKFGYKVHKQEQEDFEASQSTGNKLRGEKLAQDKHDADVAGIDYESRKDLLDENEMTTSAADRARGADIDNTDMQSQEQQDEAEADTNGFSKFIDEREHIELMTSVLKSAAGWALRPLNPSTAYGIEGAGVAEGLRKDYFAAGVNQAKLTDAIQRIMSYARSFGRPKSRPEDFGENVRAMQDGKMVQVDSTNPDIHEDMLLGGNHYIAPLAMLLTPRFMAQVADTRKADLPLFEQLRSFTAKNMLLMMVPDPMSGVPALGGAKLATLIGALSGKTDADKQTGEARPDQLKWASQDVSSKGRDTFLQSLIVDSAGRPTVRKRARFTGTDYESIVSRYEKSAERISDERIAKGEERLAAMVEKLKTFRPGSDEGYKLAKKIDALRKNIDDAYARPGLEKLNTKAAGDQTEQVPVTGTAPVSRGVRRKKSELIQPEVGPATPLGVRQKVNQKQAAEENEGGLGRTTPLASSLSQETVDLKTDEANGRIDALTKNLGGAVDRLRAKPAAAKNKKPPTLNIWHGSNENAELSNLAARPFTFNKRDYVSVEHAYQSNKSGKFDQATFDKYKEAGKKLPGTLGTKTAEGWNVRLMKALVEKSFAQNPEAAAKLKATGNAAFTHTQDKGIWATEFPRILTEVRAELGQEKAAAPAAPAAPRSVTTLAMNYRDGQDATHVMRPEFRGKDTMDLILSGDRTATTGTWNRVKALVKGDVFTVTGNGKTALVRATSDPYHVRDVTAEEWSKLEGWAPSVYNALYGTKDSYQIRYELVNKSEAAPTSLLTNPPAAPAAHQAKETAKLLGADLVLSPISTPGYAGDLGRAAQAEGKLLTKVTPDVAGKTVLVSVPGKNRGFTAMPALIARVTKALDNGATVRTDNQANAERAWNIDGEGALRAALIAGGYVETSGKEFSSWTKGEAAVMKNEQAAPVEATTSAPFMPPPNFAEIIKTRSWLQKVLGPDIEVMMEESFPGMTWNGEWDAVKNLMRIATANPIGIMTVAHHEAVHAFFSKIMSKSPEAKEMLENAFGTPQMRKRLAGILAVKHDGSDASKAKAKALNDLIMGDSAESREERVAYGFQFHMAGALAIDKKPETFFEKVQALMRRVFGAVRDSEKALAILESFDAGKLVEPSAAGVAIQKIMQTGEWRANFMKRFDKQGQALYAEIMANELVGINSESATAKAIALMWHTNPGRAEKEDEPGVINLTQIRTRQYHTRMQNALEGLIGPNSVADLKALGEALNNHTEPKAPHVAKAKRMIQAMYKQFHVYAREAGLNLGERFGTNGDSDFHTRVMDLEYMVNHRAEFVAMLTEKYHHVLKSAKAGLVSAEVPAPTETDVANKIYENLVNREGVDDNALSVSREDGILNPLFTSGELRTLHWIRDEDMAPYLSTDVVANITQYLRQGVRAAEYTRRFGRGGELLRDMMAREGDSRPVEGAGGKVRVEKYAEDGPVLTELKAAAAKLKLEGDKATEWVDRRMEDLERMNGAMEGSLGKDINPKYRKFQGAVMTLQTLRLLPFMLFSSMMDPNSIRVAGGTGQDMLDAYKRGFGAVWDNWKDMLLGNPLNMRDQDGDEMAALEAGVIDNILRTEQMGTVASSEFSAGVTREINHKFFRAIGITHWDRAMRIVATRAARRSIASMIRGDSKEHSARWLKEVGLKDGQGTVNDDGMLITTRRELAALRMKDEAFVALAEIAAREEGTNVKEAALNLAAKELEPVHSALNRWVTRAIVSPNAAIRPTRFSDPHFAMFAQFKSFTYAFQETTMRYALREAKYGNVESSARLLIAVPIMIVADMTKAMVMGGGSLPGYMANWTMADWVGHGINRGLSSVPQMGLETLHDPMSLFGPTVSQAGDVLASPFQGDVLKTGLDAVPGLRYARGAI